MDTVTQALLGATIGQAGFAQRLGPRAKWWGAAAGLLPDLDVIAVATHGPFGEMLYHRGFTHSLWFGFVAGPALAWLVHRAYAARGRDPGDLRAWAALFVLALVTHPLIDWNTPYGTQLLAPFSRERFALDGVGIIDPFYSVPLILALIAGFVMGRSAAALRRAHNAALAALLVSSLYMVYGAVLNARLEAQLAQHFRAEGAHSVIVRAYPTMLQPWLRRVVARSDDTVHVGWVSTFAPEAARWQSFAPTEHPLVDELDATPEGRLFRWFAMDETHGRVRDTGDGFVVELEDLRYGLPGPPEEGMWGVRAFFDRGGTLRGPVERFRRARDLGRLGFAELFRAAFGDLSALDG